MKKDKNECDLIMRLVNFDLPSVSNGAKMNKDSFLELLNNKDFNMKLENGLLKGLMTHSGRDQADANTERSVPYFDFISKHPDLANITRDVWYQDNSIYASMDILKDTPGGKLALTHFKNDMFIGISMSTESDYNYSKNEYFIKDLVGNDFTTDPAFIGSGVVRKNFSRGRSGLTMVNFSVPNAEIIPLTPYANFAFREFHREFIRPLYQTLQLRIKDVIRNLKSSKPEFIEQYKTVFKQYINDIIFNWISNAMKSDGMINIQLGLRISPFIKDKKILTTFYTKINMIKKIYSRQGFLTRQNQKVLSNVTNDLILSVWKYICNKAGIDISQIYGSDDTDSSINTTDAVMNQDIDNEDITDEE